MSKHWPGSGAQYDETGETGSFNGWVLTTTDPNAKVEPLWPAGTFQAVFADIFQEAFDLLVERQKKYGPNNISTQGMFGVFTRLRNDKIERIKRSLNGTVEHGEIVLGDVEDFEDESFEDALKDIANYALIMLALKRGLWGKPLA